MRSLARVVMILVAVAAGGVLAGCASSGAMEASAESQVRLRVNNDLVPPTSLSVYAVSESGTRSLVGVVSPSSERTLLFNPAGSERVRFLAETTEGEEIVSNPIVLGGGDVAEWNVQANIVTVTG